MKNLIFAGLLAIGILGAQVAAPPSVVLSVAGTWPYCGNSIPADSWMCVGYEESVGNYILQIHGDSSLATHYRYRIKARMADGTEKIVTGTIDRADNFSGYSGTLVKLGGLVAGWSAEINELATVGVMTAGS